MKKINYSDTEYWVNKVTVVNRSTKGMVLDTDATTIQSFTNYADAKAFYETVELPEYDSDIDVYKEIFEFSADS